MCSGRCCVITRISASWLRGVALASWWHRRVVGGSLTPMAIAVTSAAVVQIYENVESHETATVRNDGPNTVTISKDPAVAVGAADGFTVASAATQNVDLAPGEGLYAICASSQTASVEVI